MNKTEERPPANAKRIYRVAELPPRRAPATYVIYDSDGGTREKTLCKRRRQILELLMVGPVYCASPVRISDMVFVLREEVGLNIETRMYPGDTVTGAGSYGIYFLKDRVERAVLSEAAA